MSEENCLPNGIPYCSHFYMVRHGQTEDNANKIVSGAARDTNLTEEGRGQAVALTSILAKLNPAITCVITSEKQRTKDTADLACSSDELRNLPRIVDARINERNYGEAEGMSDEARANLKATKKVIAGEESKDAVLARTLQAVAEHTQDGKIPLFVTHGGNILRMLEETNAIVPYSKSASGISNATMLEFVAPKNRLEHWQVNVIGLNEKQEITRSSFYASQNKFSENKPQWSR